MLADNFGIKPTYKIRTQPKYFIDSLFEDNKTIHQPEVYPFAAYLARRFGAKYIIDIGCGHASKIVALYPEFNIIGIDYGANIEYCRQHYTFGDWIEWDLDKVGDIPITSDVARQAIVVCADVIEHLIDPTHLLANIHRLLNDAHLSLLTTPERDLVRGKDDLGPPLNPHRVREWNLSEFQSYVTSAGLRVAFAGLTFNNDRYREKKTSMIILENNHFSSFQPAPPDFKVVAIINAYNESDIVLPSLQFLIDQGIEVYLIDYWSTDSTLDLAKQFLGKGLIGWEKFPTGGPAPVWNWGEQLRHVEELSLQLKADWFIHHDIDEERLSPWLGTSYRDGIYHVDQSGFNCIDHTVIEFPPINNSYTNGDPLGGHFHFFEFGKRSSFFLQIKAWKNLGRGVSLRSSGGHRAEFEEAAIYPYKFLTRHYPVRSQAHGQKKFFRERQPRVDPQERASGWNIHYDAVDVQASFIRSSEHLIPFESQTFYRDFLVERLSGVGILPSTPSLQPQVTVCIVGMHRSGTSMIARLLNLCGLYLGDDQDLMPPRADNPEGFWENVRFVEINESILDAFGGGWDLPQVLEPGWETQPKLENIRRYAQHLLETFKPRTFWGWKDPRSSLTLPFWKSLIPNLKVVVCLRHPLEVVGSLTARGDTSFNFGMKLWFAYHQHLLAAVSLDQCVITHYDSYFVDPQSELQRVLRHIGAAASPAQLERAGAAVSTSLRHHRVLAPEDLAKFKLTDACRLYETLCERAGEIYERAPQTSQSPLTANIFFAEDWITHQVGLESTSAESSTIITRQSKMIEELKFQLLDLRRQLRAREEKIYSLEADLAQLAKTKFWKLSAAYWEFRRRLREWRW